MQPHCQLCMHCSDCCCTPSCSSLLLLLSCSSCSRAPPPRRSLCTWPQWRCCAGTTWASAPSSPAPAPASPRQRPQDRHRRGRRQQRRSGRGPHLGSPSHHGRQDRAPAGVAGTGSQGKGGGTREGSPWSWAHPARGAHSAPTVGAAAAARQGGECRHSCGREARQDAEPVLAGHDVRVGRAEPQVQAPAPPPCPGSAAPAPAQPLPHVPLPRLHRGQRGIQYALR